jgi:hypothetical protein
VDIQEGDVVLVNVAPFIGSPRPHKDSVPCLVLAAQGEQFQVCARPPYREVTLWVARQWIESRLESRMTHFEWQETELFRPQRRRALTRAR